MGPSALIVPHCQSLTVRIPGDCQEWEYPLVLRISIQLNILVPSGSLFPFFLFPIFCNAAEVVERGKARQVDKNLMWSHGLVPSGHAIAGSTCVRGAGRELVGSVLEMTQGPWLSFTSPEKPLFDKDVATSPSHCSWLLRTAHACRTRVLPS
jgi:hypothetical protein